MSERTCARACVRTCVMAIVAILVLLAVIIATVTERVTNTDGRIARTTWTTTCAVRVTPGAATCK